MKLAWLTDIHLNFLGNDARIQFYQVIVKTNCDAVLISGDIAEAPSLVTILKEMESWIKKPIYFILGNHDYYRGRVNEVCEAMTALTQTEKLLCWLPASGVQVLDNNIILVGQDGWADGRLGNYYNSNISLNDSRMIDDLFQEKLRGKQQLLKKMQQLSDADAKQLHNDLQQALSQHPKKIIVLIHVPPFKEACLYECKISDDNWLPFYSSKIMGDVLIKIAKKNSTIEFLVLCGHTHNNAEYQPLGNLTIKVGKAEYYQPEVQEIIDTCDC